MKAIVTIPKNGVFGTFFTKENIELANSLGEIIWNESDKPMSVEEIKRNIGDCDVYIGGWNAPRLTEEILECAPKLKLHTHLAGTVAPYTSDEEWDRGIKVIAGNDFFAESVAEGTIGYMLSSLRRINLYSSRLMNEGIWKDENFFNESLIYKKVGLISYGAIGKHMVRKLQPFNVELLVYDIFDIPKEDMEKYSFRQSSMEEIFSTCDIISVHTPLNEHTVHLINDYHFSMMKKDSLLVNTSRGAVLDQQALSRHLAAGDFRAALDVYEKEPLPKDDPLHSAKDALLMPHMGGPTIDIRAVLTKHLLIESQKFVDDGVELLPKDEITRERAQMMTR
ncbi:MAG: hydroxyacid dehydrogenase [Clostridia bacterium]|nr:hydroxyacid dehydrogenase [Clostridia bacterium]